MTESVITTNGIGVTIRGQGAMTRKKAVRIVDQIEMIAAEISGAPHSGIQAGMAVRF